MAKAVRRSYRSDPAPERLLRSRGLFSEGTDNRSLVTFRDYPLYIAFDWGWVTHRQLEAGEKYHFHWYSSGLAGTVPAMRPDAPIWAVGGDDFGGMPRSLSEFQHRMMYRQAVRHVGMLLSRMVEVVACDYHLGMRVDADDPFKWLAAKVNCPRHRHLLSRGLNKLADWWAL